MCLDALRASLYPIKEAMEAPAPGRMPIRLPMIQDRTMVGAICFISLPFNSTRSSNFTSSPALRIFFSASTSTWDMENRPIRVAVKGSPSYRAAWPKVTRNTPFIGSIPSVESSRPSAPEIRPFSRESVLTPAIIVRPKMDSQKYSGLPKAIASFASAGAKKYREMQLSSPPKNEEIMAVPSAFPAFPFSVS